MDYLRVRDFDVNLQRVATFGHALANKTKGLHFCKILDRTLIGLGLLENVCKGFALLGTALPTIRKGAHFWTFVPKGLRFFPFSGFGVKGS